MFAVLSCAGLAFAQDGSISGTVQDSTGASLPNATVRLTNLSQNALTMSLSALVPNPAVCCVPWA